MGNLKLKPDSCSPLGKLLLRYVDEHPKLNLSRLAKEIGMSRPGLGWVCLKHTNPNEETATKIAAVLGLEKREVARLVYWNKLESLDDLDPIEQAAAGACMDKVFESLHDLDHTLYRKSLRPSDFQLYRQAFEMVKGCLLLPDRGANESKPPVNQEAVH